MKVLYYKHSISQRLFCLTLIHAQLGRVHCNNAKAALSVHAIT
jgi:hypothetical protein